MSGDLLELLISQSKQGDKKAIEKILFRYEPLIKKYSRHFFIKGYDDEDLEQIASLAIIKAINRFDEKNGANFTGFVDVVIRNDFMTIINKKENKTSYTSLESVNEEGVELKEMFADDFDLEGSYIENEDLYRLRKEIEKLDSEDRKILLMAFSEYGGLKKYSNMTNIGYFTCRRKRDRLVEKIKKELNKKNL